MKFEEDDVMDSVLKSRYNFDIKNIQIEYESGKKLKLSENKFIEEKNGENIISLLTKAPGYTAEIVLEKLEEGVFSHRTRLIPNGDCQDKAHKVITLNISSMYDEKMMKV